jgi:ATP-binding cassette subfamily C protein CydC
MKRVTWLAVGGLTAGSGALLAGVGLIATAGWLIARAAERPPILDLMLLFVAVRLFGITRPTLRYLERLASHDVTFRVLKTVRGWFMGALLPLSSGQLAAFRSGDLLSRMAADVDALQDSYLRVLAPALVALTVSAVVVTGFAWIDMTIAATLFFSLVCYGVGWSWLAYRQAGIIGAGRNEARRSLSADLVSVIQGIDDVLTCGYERRALERFTVLQRQMAEQELRDSRLLALHAAGGVLLTMLAACAVLALSVSAVGSGQLTTLAIAPLVLATIAAFEAVEGLPAAWQSGALTKDAARRVLEVVRMTPAIIEVPAPLPFPRHAPRLEFERVTFAYQHAPPTLRDVSFHIGAAEHVAVAGPTGAGKTTLLSLVMRGWDPSQGLIRLDGVDLRGFDLDDLRAHTAVLPQHVHVFNDTLRENVRLGCRHASDEHVREVLCRARLESFLARAGRGLDTVLGEYGARMSAGERQRLSLARVLLMDPVLVTADEPTAQLDMRHERDFLDTLVTWAQHRTLVIASHRRAVLAIGSRVLRVAHGGVVAA